MATSGKDTGIVGYNVQAAVDTEHHIIVVHEATNVGTGRRQLANIAVQARDELGANTLEAVADRGYYDGNEIKACAEAGIIVTLPKPQTSSAKAEGRFDRQDVVYNATDDVYRYVALSDVAAQRRLRRAVRLLLERARNGDPGEMMRGLRHASEHIFNPDWGALAELCIELSASKRPGTRRWAIDQLVILNDPRARQVFDNALHDESEEIRRIAALGLERLDGMPQ